MPSTSDSVKVAVRVRPFNQREKNAGSSCILSMRDKTTVIRNPENGDTKSFSYDHSYWSHDGYRETPSGIFESDSPSSVYTDQRMVFNDLGQGVLDNAWQGYNAALFAYGQTGSGKSYSMIGYGPNKGIVPITCEELFKAIEDNKDDKKQLRVFFSMLEIYNEQVRDLLVKTKPPHGGLKVRQNPKTGFYVEGLKQVPVSNYKEIEKLMESGTINRTTASTNMNATSSRSHMVITIRFEQVFINESGQSNTRSSDINLVDLAGSERADSTGATGDRLKEGSAINQSLSTLGNVISALADQAMGKKKVMVPYRDSVLTKLLQSALGGNSRTIMIAALSPADINYEETLSTLRYADRAKKIQNKATINESPTDRLIRELKEENARLMALLKKQGGGDTSDIQRMLEDNQKRMGDMQLSWEQRLEQARKEWERAQHLEVEESPQEWKKYPYITNVNEDPQLSGVIKHAFCQEKTVIGKTGSKNVTVVIRGLGIQPTHAEFFCDGRSSFIKPCSEASVVLINGTKVREKTALRHLDRLKLGSTSVFLYIGYPKERKGEHEMAMYDFDFFMTELAEHEGVSMDIQTPREPGEQHDMSNMVLFQDFVDLMPKISEANAVSEELKRNVKFEPIVKSAASHDPRGTATGKEVIVKVTNSVSQKKWSAENICGSQYLQYRQSGIIMRASEVLTSDSLLVWIWSKVKFLNRKDLIDELYLKFLDGDSVILTRDKDPFWDPVEDVFLGSSHIMLQSISYCAEVDEHFTIHNYHGKEEAVVHVKMLPCNESGRLIAEDDLILEPKDLLGKSLNFLFTLTDCMGIRWISEENSRGVYCRFAFYKHKPSQTKAVWHKSYVDFDYKQHLSYKPVKKDLLDYFQHNSLVLELWGKQISEDEELRKPSAKILHQSHDHTADVLSQLKIKEDELEQLQAEHDELKRENFKLKQSVMRTEEKLRLTEMRKEFSTQRKRSVERKPSYERRPSVDIKVSADDATKPASVGGLDVEFAKSLREFFREAREIQTGMKDMREYVSATKDNVNGNGLRKSFEQHEKRLISTDEKLSECLTLLKKSAATALRKSRPTTE